MSHQSCLQAITDRRGDIQTRIIIHAFLYQRKMKVKVSDTYSTHCHMPGGSPQGSVLVSRLFCLTVDSLVLWTISADSSNSFQTASS